MSNYNSTLQSNNADLQTILNTINQLPNAGTSGETAEWSKNEDAIINKTISTYMNDRITNIGDCAFYGCDRLKNVSFPVCASIGYSAFYGCGDLISVNFPLCTFIYASAFAYCADLTNVSFPVCSFI